MFHIRFLLYMGLFLALTYPSYAQLGPKALADYQLENLINQSLVEFPFSHENKLRLATYAELKGHYSSEYQSLTLDFADLGSLVIYPRSCILKTRDRRLYYLNKSRNGDVHVQAFNEKINELLDRIFLFSNHNAAPEKIEFVDTFLARKNIEPYEKIFLRHLLLKYGRYDSHYQRVEFHTDWLPNQTYLHLSAKTKTVVRKPVNPLWIKLDKEILRGYFIRDNGTVFVEDVERDVFYASGEQYAPNIAAFKSFLYKMLAQTTQFIIGKEKKRLEEELIIEDLYAHTASATDQYGLSRGAQLPKVKPAKRQVQTSLYKQNDWIPMMLGMLRSQNINIGDADIIRYFVDEPYFRELYDQMILSERRKVDAYLKNRR